MYLKPLLSDSWHSIERAPFIPTTSFIECRTVWSDCFFVAAAVVVALYFYTQYMPVNLFIANILRPGLHIV